MKVEAGAKISVANADLQSIIDILYVLDMSYPKGLSELPIPSTQDEQIIGVVYKYASFKPDARALLSQNLKIRQMNRLRGFSERMASLTLCENNPGRLVEAMLAVAVEDVHEYKETYPILSLLRLSSRRLSVDFDTLLSLTISYSGERGREYLENFRNNSATIEMMGYIEIPPEDGHYYRRTW